MKEKFSRRNPYGTAGLRIKRLGIDDRDEPPVFVPSVPEKSEDLAPLDENGNFPDDEA